MTVLDREAVLAGVDLGELLTQLGEARGLRAKGRQYPCPSREHDQSGDTPPVTLGEAKQGHGIWNCHSCPASGSAVDALIAAGGARDAKDALTQLSGEVERRHVAQPQPVQRQRQPPRVVAPADAPTPGALAAIERRKGWTAPTLERLGVGWLQAEKRFAIPVADATGRPTGRVLYQPGGDPKSLADGGTQRQLFPAPESLEGDEAWLVEGEPDGISMHELGLAASGVPGTEGWKSAWASRFSRFKRAVVVADCDTEGRRLARAVAIDLAEVGVEVRVVDLGPGRDDKYDVGDLLVEAGAAEARAQLERLAQSAKVITTATAHLERAAVAAEQAGLPLTLRDGADVLAATETFVPAVWGKHPNVLWAEGEPLLLTAPTGAGKTTLAQQIILRRCGVLDAPLLDLTVNPSKRPVLYLSLDRDKQAQRSMRRMTETVPRGRLLWHSNLGGYRPAQNPPAQFVDWLRMHDVGTLVVDSLYGLLATLKDDRVLDWYAHLTRELAEAAIEVMVLHHNRKAGKDDVGSRIDHIYGGSQIGWAAGSVLALTGEPGSAEVDCYHVKQPARLCGPWTLTHDHAKGVTTSKKHPTIEEFLAAAGTATTKDIVAGCHLGDGRELERRTGKKMLLLVEQGVVREVEGGWQLAAARKDDIPF